MVNVRDVANFVIILFLGVYCLAFLIVINSNNMSSYNMSSYELFSAR